MKYKTINTDEATAAFEYLTKLVGQESIVEVKKVHPTRSLAHNRYYHLLLGIAGLEFGYSTEEMKVVHKRDISPTIFVYEKKDKKFIRKSSTMDSKYLSRSIEQLKKWCAEGGLILPEPDEQEKLIYYSNLIEKEGIYL